MTNQYSPHQSRGLRPEVSATVSQPRCPISGLLIAPGDGDHLVMSNAPSAHPYGPQTVSSLYVHRWVTWVATATINGLIPHSGIVPSLRRIQENLNVYLEANELEVVA